MTITALLERVAEGLKEMTLLKMNPRPRNYCSFYVKPPFAEYKVGATSTPDYSYYNLLKVWRRGDRSFNYYDAHCLSYMLREKGLDYEEDVLPVIHDRLDHSKNLILILTSYTKESIIMNEETEYAINVKHLPVVVVYPELSQEEILNPDGSVSEKARQLWETAPVFKASKDSVFVQHVPFDKKLIHEANCRIDL